MCWACLPILSNEPGKAHIRATMSQAAAVGEVAVSAGLGLGV